MGVNGMTTKLAFMIGTVAPLLLLGAGTAVADDMGPPPAPGCAVPHVPQIGNCSEPPLVLIPTPAARPWEVLPPEDPWRDPIITEHEVDNTLNQWLPDGWIIGEIPINPPVPLPEGLPPGTVIVPGGVH
jgi:hypothetical protein